jgi:DNA topoisomerase IB
MDHPFNTILLAEMLLDVAQARINNSAELESWIRQRAEFGKSPLLKDRVGW